jgi:hypothetical protein
MAHVTTPAPRRDSVPRYVTAAKLYAALRTQLGCVDMGWRDETSWYWVTPNGVEFCVAPPTDDANCRILLEPGSGGELCFPYDYARELLAQVRAMITARTPAASPDRLELVIL